MQDNIVVLSFAQESLAYQALAELKTLAQQHLSLRHAAVMQRDRDGQVLVKQESMAGAVHSGPLAGTLVGSLVGVLAGPIGVLLGTASGALIGSAVTLDKAEQRLGLLEQAMQAMPAGTTSLIASVSEPANDGAIDALAKGLGAHVFRRPLAEVQAEVDAQHQADAAAARQARRDSLGHWREEVGEGVERLKSRIETVLHADKKP